MTRASPLMVSAALALSTAACGDGTGAVCLPVETLALEVEIRDANTDEFRADSARGVAQDGDYTDSLVIVRRTSDDLGATSLGGAYGRPGTYAVRIERAGYQPWDTVGVRVFGGECGPITKSLVARLSPAMRAESQRDRPGRPTFPSPVVAVPGISHRRPVAAATLASVSLGSREP